MMTSRNQVDFYSRKPTTLPRFVYRRLATALEAPGANRAAAIDAALQDLLQSGQPDLRKFKFVLPEALRRKLTPEEAARMDEAMAPRRRHTAQMRLVYPYVADEFGLNAEFLHAALKLDGGPQLPSQPKFYTIGSCFARNIAEFLSLNGVQARTFGLAEDLNSPISNAFLFDLLQRPAAERLAVLRDWIARIHPEVDAGLVADAAVQRGATVDELGREISAADCVVLTLGNVVDFFGAGAPADAPLMHKVYPKFVAVPGAEDIGQRSNAAARLKKLGASLRLASHGEAREAIEACLAGIRSVSAAPIVVTLSPVPVDSVIGLAEPQLGSAVEADCVSKSRLRSAFDEVLAQGRFADLYYFPSFEIVRWIAPMSPFANFGLDDAASRHVSSPILHAICRTFMDDYLRLEEASTQAGGAA